MTAAALIVAAGQGRRAGGDRPKQYEMAGDRSILTHTVEALVRHGGFDPLRVVVHSHHRGLYETATEGLRGLVSPVIGGETRQQSVLNGLESLVDRAPKSVLIHDGARPFVDTGTISRVMAALEQHDGAIAAVAITDTVKRTDGSRITETVDRRDLWAAQTPQAFRFDAILAAHRRAAEEGLADFTDDAAVAQWAGLDVTVAEGNRANRKITTAADVEDARRHFASRATMMPRVGHGFDVHAFAPGDHVMLCGVRIAHDRTLTGHSDADVGLHAITDAILGALCDGDIGQHFPPGDDRWKGASSDRFLAAATERVAVRGGTIGHVDVTLVCEAPKVAPHATAMRSRIAEILGLGVGQVSVKATTSEGLGFTGRREGIAAYATATVFLPADGGPRGT